MRNLVRFIVVVCALVTVVPACSKDKSSSPPASGKTEEKAPAKEAKHAATDVVPGSHEDWCGEHGVPESQCTKCNPDLIAAFKATGDWCNEHGVPESQCLKCNPDLKIVRPPPKGEATPVQPEGK